jgi:hypothetical protein
MHEEILKRQLEREREAIRAMQYRRYHWTGPVLDFFWRKPWRSTSRPAWVREVSFVINVANFLGWLRNAHDCADPSIACSCQGGFRFPHPVTCSCQSTQDYS